MHKKKILLICGSINQTTQMHQIAQSLPDLECWFTPYYADGFERFFIKAGLAEMTVMGNKLVQRCLGYLQHHQLPIDSQGLAHDYDLVVTCSDLIIQNNIRQKRIILVQEGMTDSENWVFHCVKYIPFLPRWLAGTSTTGLSHAYQLFCVASEGYRELFVNKGVDPEKICVTGIPNFDNCKKYYENDFPYRDFVLVCTSDTRETFKYENRQKFIENALTIAKGRQLIFKLHPNENFDRATQEINCWAPNALVYTSGSAEHMIAHCSALITRFSSTVYVGLALGKEVYSDYPIGSLTKLTPIQNNGSSANRIAEIVRHALEREIQKKSSSKNRQKASITLFPVLKYYSNLLQQHLRS